MKSKIGFLKFYSERLRQWVGWAQFAMIAYLTIVQTDMNAMLLGIGILLLLVWTYFDTVYVFPREAAAVIELNPMWQLLWRRLDEIESKVSRRTRVKELKK